MNKFLTVLLWLFCFPWMSRSQEVRKTVTGSVFEVRCSDVSCDSLKPSEINIRLEGLYMDTENYYNNSFDIVLTVSNQTGYPLRYNDEINCWHDSGFDSPLYAETEKMKTLLPQKSGELKIHVFNTTKKLFSKNGLFTVFYRDAKVAFPISLELHYQAKTEDRNATD